MKAKRYGSLAALVGLVLLVGGCASVRLHATQESTVSKGLVRIEVAKIEGDILTFDVYNLSKLQLMVLRDKIVLETPTGRRGREPGGVQRFYNIEPGGAHDVKVKFDFSDCAPGQEVKVRFDSAILVDVTPVPIAPIPFVCG
jgi:hypothetical protein